MGFLLGAYGKLAAGSRYRSLQARMMRIQSRLRRATRDVANMEKMISRQEKTLMNNLTIQSNMAKQMAMGALQSLPGMQDILQKIGGYSTNGTLTELTAAEKEKYAQYQMGMNNMQFMSEVSTAQMKQQVQDMIENMRETMLEPLKDEEDELQLEKDTLESQIQVAKTDYEACQKMEQADVKMLTPNYTGGQG